MGLVDKAIKTVLNLIDKQDKIINLMADCIAFGGHIHEGEPKKVKKYFRIKAVEEEENNNVFKEKQ